MWRRELWGRAACTCDLAPGKVGLCSLPQPCRPSPDAERPHLYRARAPVCVDGSIWLLTAPVPHAAFNTCSQAARGAPSSTPWRLLRASRAPAAAVSASGSASVSAATAAAAVSGSLRASAHRDGTSATDAASSAAGAAHAPISLRRAACVWRAGPAQPATAYGRGCLQGGANT